MSYEKQPEPVLPNYNPSAWDYPLSAEEQEVLDAHYVKYPIAQNAPLTFPGGITTQSINNGTSTTGTLSIMTGISSSGNINIGNETTNNTTTTLQGNTTITNPTISRPISFSGFTAPTSGQMFFNNRVTSLGFYTSSTTYKSYAPTNNLTPGVYLLLGFVYLSSASLATSISTSLCYSDGAMSNDQSLNNAGGAINVINDNTFEAYGYKATTGATGGNYTLNLSTIYTVLPSPNNNIAMAVLTGVVTAGLYVDIKYCRLA